MKKIFSILMLLTLIIFATPAQAQADVDLSGKLIPCTSSATWQGKVVDDVDFLALRSGPSANYSLLTKIPPGAYIEITYSAADPIEYGYRDANPNFVQVSYRGISGWAHSRYIIRLKKLREYA